MSRQSLLAGVLLTAVFTLAAGCRPQQPFYLFEDGDLSHYIDVATEIEYPDAETARLDEVEGAIPPLTLDNPDPSQIWELSLEEAVQTALANSKVIRIVGGGGFSIGMGGPNGVLPQADRLLSAPEAAVTVYDPALAQANPRFGREAALSAFDTQFSTSVFWEKNDTPNNIAGIFQGFRPLVLEQDLGTFQARLAKTTATGGRWSLTHNVNYEFNNAFGSRRWPSDWNVNLEAEFRQPLLQGNGVQFNRIAGPGSIPGFNNGVMIARINEDVALADFEAWVRNLVSDVERAYWNLHFTYRNLDAMKMARDRALETWRKAQAGFPQIEAKQDEALARHEYFFWRGQSEQAQSALYKAENRLRYMMGLASTDGRLIRPHDELTLAEVDFDWYETHAEALARNVNLRRQKWRIKQRELELIAAKNYLLPRFDAVGRYRWRGLGDDLIDSNNSRSNAYGSMTGGDFQEWQLGLELSVPLGFRKEMAGVRYAQLNLAKDRAVLKEQELELSHQLADALRELKENHAATQTNFNIARAARNEYEAWQAQERAGMRVRTGALDRVFDALRRVVQSEVSYYASLRDYNLAITQIHYRKGSLLEYNGVHLAEGPWPGKAYFDALRRARGRDASLYLDYGFTRPKVISRGPYQQHAGGEGLLLDEGGVLGMPGIPAGDVPLPVPESWDEPPVPDVSLNANPTRAGKTYDLGSLDLDPLAIGPAGEEASPDAGQPTVRPVSYKQVESAAESNPPSPASGGWTGTKGSRGAHEPLANPPSAEGDRPASGWKGVQ